MRRGTQAFRVPGRAVTPGCRERGRRGPGGWQWSSARPSSARCAVRSSWPRPGVPLGPNPRVGCVLLADDGTEVAEGHHRGAGTPHAEAAALAEAGEAARGTTAVVTLEPCDHTGRTGPCSHALVAAGVRRVVFAQPTPPGRDRRRAHPARGRCRGRVGPDGARGAGAEPRLDVLPGARPALRHLEAGHHPRRPQRRGRTAPAAWITSTPARRDSHRLRGQCDVLLVGTGTVEVDRPAHRARRGRRAGPTSPCGR